MATNKRARSRNSALAKAAILKVARAHFIEEGYGGLSVRKIAIAAGYDVALVGRYFGSKEALFREVLMQEFRPEPMLAANREKFGVECVKALYSETPRQDVLDHFTLVIRALTMPSKVPTIRKLVHDQFLVPLAKWLGGKNSHARASLILIYITGAALQSDWAGPLSSAESKRFRMLLQRSLQALVDGEEFYPLGNVPAGSGANRRTLRTD